MGDPGFLRRGGGRSGGANLQGGAATYFLAKFFPENYMNMKEFGPEASLAPPLDPPMKVAVQISYCFPRL